jgi:hypothetical protein
MASFLVNSSLQPIRRESRCYSGVPVVLQWCYSGVAVVLQWCCSSITVVLQWCYSGFTVMMASFLVNSSLHPVSGVTVVLHWCYSGVTVVLQWCYSDDGLLLSELISPPCQGRAYHLSRLRLSSQFFAQYDELPILYGLLSAV